MSKKAEEEEEEEEIEEEDDERREAAISSRPSLQPGFKNSRISQDQLSKLQELHKRRLQMKSKLRDESKDGSRRSQGKNLKQDSDASIEDSRVTNLKNQQESADLSAKQENVAPKKRQKLYWGLDTKERWERKANM